MKKDSYTYKGDGIQYKGIEPSELKQVQKCPVCGQTFEPIRYQLFCDVCLHELRNVVRLSREGML